MTRFITTLLCFGLFVKTFGQDLCAHQKKVDSSVLVTFSIELKKAVMTMDMDRIADFFQFPFLIKSCIMDKKNNGNHQDSLISREMFVSSKYGDFFGCWFMETVSKGYISGMLVPYEENETCKLFFSYPACFPSKESLCKLHYFSVEKIDGHYKITSSWLSR